MWTPNPRYPDPAFEAIQPSFLRYRLMNASVERLATGMAWAEGPVWFGDGRYLLWSDIPNDRMMRWDETSGAVSVFRQSSHHANGNTRDRSGRLITCEHVGRRVTRTEYDGSITVLMDRWEGKRLSSPNDVVVKSDGSIWFTDPPFGLSHYEGEGRRAGNCPHASIASTRRTARPRSWPTTCSGRTGCASRRTKRFYNIVESRGEPTRKIRAFDVMDGVRLSNNRVLIDAGPGGTPDGMRCDVEGNIWAGWGMGTPELDGVMVFNPAGEKLGRIALPERCANVCFGGSQAQPAVYGGKPFFVRRLRQYAGCAGRLARVRTGLRLERPKDNCPVGTLVYEDAQG